MRAVVVLGIIATLGSASGCVAQDGAALPPLNLQETANVEILVNSDFEDPDAKAWVFSDWPPRPETGAKLIADSVYYTQDVAHSGEWSLCLDLTTVGDDRILLAQQKFGLDKLAPHDGRPARLSAWILLGSGPAGYQGGLSMRQWGPPGAPPIVGRSLRMAGSVDEWAYHKLEFTLRLGETTRGDATVGMRQVPELRDSPIIYVDDVKLEILGEPDLRARLQCGAALFSPDAILPVRVDIAGEAWEAGMRSLRWNVTSPDGLTGFAEGDLTLSSPTTVVELIVPELAEGRYAARLALGAAPGERAAEVLLPFRKVAGPFADH